jgi:hypothetical protein
MNSLRKARLKYLFQFILLIILIAGVGGYATVGILEITKPEKTVEKEVKHEWTKADSIAYANDQVLKDAHKQFICLKKLWGKESNWNHKAYNPVKVMGKNAGGIPQLLGLSPLTPPTRQIERGLSYITHRFVVPCRAWSFWQKHGWY